MPFVPRDFPLVRFAAVFLVRFAAVFFAVVRARVLAVPLVLEVRDLAVVLRLLVDLRLAVARFFLRLAVEVVFRVERFASVLPPLPPAEAVAARRDRVDRRPVALRLVALVRRRRVEGPVAVAG